MKLLLAGLALLVTFPAVVGSAAGVIATAPHPAPAARLFSWVPSGGYPDRFPYGQCTWWSAYNRDVSWGGTPAFGSSMRERRASPPATSRASARSPSTGQAEATTTTTAMSRL